MQPCAHRPARELLTLPPELLVSALSLLPIRDLLSFSLASRASRELANASLRTLSFGIYPCKLAALPRPELEDRWPGFVARVFMPEGGRHLLDPYVADCFHDKLASSVLHRYWEGLRVLELNIWRLSFPVAAALARCRGLTSLVLRREEARWGRGRGDILDAGGDRLSWRMLAGAWTRLRELTLENVRITEEYLEKILNNNPGLEELWLRDCEELGTRVWRFISTEWRGREGLEAMGFEDCGVVGDEVVGCIEALKSLQTLHLTRCTRSARELIFQTNLDIHHISVWHEKDEDIEDMVMDLIEIDPDYS